MRQVLRYLHVTGMEVSISDEKPLHMRLYSFLERFKSLFVSISDEKPLHMRLHFLLIFPLYSLRFNLRREAAPHAT